MKPYRNEYTLRNNVNLTLRTVEAGDEKDLIHQMKRVDGETKFLAREIGELQYTPEEEKDFIVNMQKAGTKLQLIAEIDGKIIGNCAVRSISNRLRYQHRASLGFAICKDYWGLGIGSHMIQTCIDFCKTEGFEQLELEVVTDNLRAMKLYEKFGFKVYTTMKRSMKYADGTYADEHIMILFLQNQN